MTPATLRFLPWARRGLAASLPPASSTGADLDSRGEVAVEVVVADSDTVRQTVRLHGPGDVAGLDPSLVIRRSPSPDTTDAEANLLAAVDFDPPDLPWAFTPVGPAPKQRLRPWLALVVVERRDGVRLRSERGAPLQVLTIDSGAADELQSLDDSWAWAHAQVVMPGDDQGLAAVLTDHGDRHSSRLLCPRRLRPNRRYTACVVPAFDAGRQRGLGTVPDGDSLRPAWSDADDHVRLPVYVHWSFATGPKGDFESLARRIAPHRSTAEVGRARMHVGAAWPGLELAPDDANRFLDMDGALQSPGLPEPALAQVPAELASGIATIVAADPETAEGGEEPPAVGPPLRTGHHRDVAVVGEGAPEWFAELNTDPRSRAAAGLGADVVRANQEELAHAAWDQVGDVIRANRRLNREALILHLGRRFYARHLEERRPDDLLRFTAPWARRTPLDGASLPTAIRATSLPDHVTDPAFRRLVAPTNRLVARAARRAGLPSRTGLVARLADGSERVDPTRFEEVAVAGTGPIPDLGAGPGGERDLTPLGLSTTVDADVADRLVDALREQRRAPPPVDAKVTAVRSDLRRTGVLTDTHVGAVRRWRASTATSATVSLTPIFELIGKAATTRGGAAGFLLDTTGTKVDVTAVKVVPGTGRVGGNVGRIGGVGRVAGTVRTGSLHGGRIVSAGRLADVADVAGAAMSPTSVPRGARFAGSELHRATIVLDPVRRVDPDQSPPADRFVVPGLIRKAAIIDRIERAFVRTVAETTLSEPVVERHVVPFDLATAANAILTRNEPLRIRDRRLAATVTFGARSVLDHRGSTDGRWAVAPGVDRVWAYPELTVAAHERLADLDPSRLCPGVGAVPTDSVTLLQTNPRFVAAFLAGMNHEMNRELRWRGYPTDRKGTPLSSFWGRIDGGTDIAPLHRWPGAGVLADQTTGGAPRIVLLIRGELFHRYPDTIVVVSRHAANGTEIERRAPTFAGRFDPDVAFFGFDLELVDLRADPASWIFALLEPPGEPRFGLDATRDVDDPTRWSDVSWRHLGPIGTALGFADLVAVGAKPKPVHAGDVARSLYQAPFAIEVAAADLLPELANDG